METDPSGQPVWMLGTGQDISDRKLLEERLIHQAFRDALTGLANRALFTDRVKHALSRRATAARSLAVLFLDLDDFKNVNDTMGHGVGDEVLKTAATRIEASVRPSDTVARLGGDEFAVLLEDISDTGEAIPVADRILATLERPIVMLGRELTITASLGIATNAASSETPDDLMRNADVAMYRAKAAGRRRRELFDPQMLTVIIDRLTLAHELENVAERGELRLHFQPILALGEQRVTAVEALVRWQHPSRGLLNPATFISLAEETKHIIGLGRWVLREACQQAAGWAPNPDGTPIRVSVNVSALQLQDVELVSDVAAALRLAKLPADRLMLEITESVLVDDPESAVRRLQALKQLGVRLAIDDFGTGYSSLSYLTRFPIDTLKIDGSFVAALRAADDGNTVARTIVEIYGS